MEKTKPENCLRWREYFREAFSGFGLGLSEALANVFLRISNQLSDRELAVNCCGCDLQKKCQRGK